MQNSNLENVQDTIKAEIRKDIKKRMPADFYGLFYVTLQNLTISFNWYDKHQLRQLVVLEILQSFPKRLSKNEIDKLRNILKDSCTAQHNSNFERDMFNDTGFYLTKNETL